MIAWLLAQAWFRKAVVIGAAVLAAVLFILGQRKAGERVGQMKEKLKNATAVEKAKERMEAVPRPDKPDVVTKLRDGKF